MSRWILNVYLNWMNKNYNRISFSLDSCIVFNLPINKKNEIGAIARKHIQNKLSKQIMNENYFKFYQDIIL